MDNKESLITTNQEINSNDVENQPTAPKPSKQRINSLDIHRGLTMFGMIIVDDAGPSFPYIFDHVEWNGFHIADVIFPSFVFIMGMAVPLAMSASRPFQRKNFIRIIALFLIGMGLNLIGQGFNFSQWRFLGVLQRLSVCYGMISLLHVATNYGQKTQRVFGVLASVCIGLIYISLMISFTNKDIGCTLQNNLSSFCNFGAYLDRNIFGMQHLYQQRQFDPQGLFTNLSAYLNAFLGYYFCLIMMDNKNNIKRILIYWTIFSGILLANVYPLSLMMPLNKKIWSISFVFITCGIAGIALTLLTLAIDVKGKGDDSYSRFVKLISQPFVYLGRNPLAIYVLLMGSQSIIGLIPAGEHNLWDQIYYYGLESWLPAGFASTLYGIIWAVILTLVAWKMYQKNIFIRL